MMKPLPNIDQVHGLIQREEKQRALNVMLQVIHGSIASHTDMHGQDASMLEHIALATQ